MKTIVPMSDGVIGIDGGGTHTKAVLYCLDGTLVARAETGPTDVDGTPFELAEERLDEVISRLMTCTGNQICVRAVFAGISGCGNLKQRNRYREFLCSICRNAERVEVGSDLLNPLFSVTSRNEAVIAICGTGAVTCAFVGNTSYRVDGHGYLLGDEGGGFSIGRKVLMAALRDEDGRGPATVLTRFCCERLGKTVSEAVDDLTRAGKMIIASFAPLAFQAALGGDSVANDIIEYAAERLAEDVLTLRHFFSCAKVPVILCGGLWSTGQEVLKARVSEKIGGGFQMIEPPLAPECGAAVKAVSLIGLEESDRFRHRIQEQEFSARRE